jgi:large subunit ribosomal protein L25
MNVVPLSAETGRETGSGPSKRLRVTDQLPGTVYGLGTPAVTVSVQRRDLRVALDTDAGTNALLELTYGGETHFALVKDLQRHPVKRTVLHVDFQRIDPEKPFYLSVPIVLEGDAKKVAAELGIVEQVLAELEVLVRPDSIPNQLVVDVSEMELDEVIAVGDLALPPGVSTDVDSADPIVTATLTRAALVEEVDGEEGEEGEEGEDGETAEGDDAGSSDDSGD